MTTRMRRRLLIGLLTAPALLVMADFLVWRLATNQLQQGLAEWVQARQEQGWTITHAAITEGGWPFSAKLIVSKVALAGGDARSQGGMAWGADELTLSVALLQPGRLIVAAGGQQRLKVAELAEVPITADRIEVSLPLNSKDFPRSADLVAERLRVEVPTGSGADALTAASLHMQLEVRLPPAPADTALVYSLQAEKIGLPAGQRWPLGPNVASLALNGVLTGPMPWNDTLPLRLSAWRDGGGTLQVEGLTLKWGPLNLYAKATLSLDEQLQPMGAATTRMTGQAAALDAMAGGGLIKPQAAMAAKAILALMSRAAEDGQPATAEVPLTLQNRTLAMGRIPLVRLPELEWATP